MIASLFLLFLGMAVSGLMAAQDGQLNVRDLIQTETSTLMQAWTTNAAFPTFSGHLVLHDTPVAVDPASVTPATVLPTTQTAGPVEHSRGHHNHSNPHQWTHAGPADVSRWSTIDFPISTLSALASETPSHIAHIPSHTITEATALQSATGLRGGARCEAGQLACGRNCCDAGAKCVAGDSTDAYRCCMPGEDCRKVQARKDEDVVTVTAVVTETGTVTMLRIEDCSKLHARDDGYDVTVTLEVPATKTVTIPPGSNQFFNSANVSASTSLMTLMSYILVMIWHQVAI